MIALAKSRDFLVLHLEKRPQVLLLDLPQVGSDTDTEMRASLAFLLKSQDLQKGFVPQFVAPRMNLPQRVRTSDRKQSRDEVIRGL